MADGEMNLSNEISGDVLAKPSRRWVLQAGAALGGGLLVGAVGVNAAAAATAAGKAPYFQPNVWVRVGRDGLVTVILPKSEMGQGVNTALPLMVAEELSVDVDQIRVELAPAGAKYGAGEMGQTTGGSTSVRTTFEPLRQAGAAARVMLVAAAAKAWNVDTASCTTANCQVLHVSTGRKMDYGALVDAAATIPAPEKVALKSAGDYKLLGKPLRRMDAPGKVNGTAQFGIDAMPAGLKLAAIAQCPVFGGKLGSYDEAAAMQVKGVVKVVKVSDSSVAVVADHTGAAKKGLAALKVQWNPGDNAKVQQADILSDLAAAAKKAPGAEAHKKGDVDKAMAGAAKKIEAVYEAPFLAHAPMEPINCTASVTPAGVEVWIGHQSPDMAQAAAAKTAGVPVEKVQIHNHIIGGGFGRKVETDMVEQAVTLSKAVGAPVKLIWSREEDIQHDFYRPYYYDTISAGLDASGKPVAWKHRVTSSAVMARFMPQFFKGLDNDAVDGAETPYEWADMRVDFVQQESHVPTGFWRGVGPTHNIFVVESFMDELAHAAGKDPVEYRQAMLKNPRTKAVLALAAEKAGWGKPLPKGWGRGVSVQHSWGTLMSQVHEVEVTPDGEVKVHRVVIAIDCGQMINPETVRAQAEGGVLFGLTAALQGEITIKDGRVEQSNFNNYLPLRMRDTPKIEVYLVENHEAPGGMGEPPTAGAAPALFNAVFAATGKRVRQIPLNKTKLV
jgi:CO/xanthine dehydrogenase Mo-binding subunit